MPFETKPVIGLITGANFSTGREFTNYFGDRVEVVMQCIVPKKFAFEDFDYVIRELHNLAPKLMDDHPSLLAFASMSITCLHGEEIVNRLEQQFGIPAIVTAQASVDALRALDCRRIAVLSPFGAALNLLERCFFERNGIEVVQFLNLFGLQNEDTATMTNIHGEQIVAALSQNLSEIDGILLDSPAFPATFELPNLDAVTNLPILTSNQALAQAAEKRLNL